MTRHFQQISIQAPISCQLQKRFCFNTLKLKRAALPGPPLCRKLKKFLANYSITLTLITLDGFTPLKVTAYEQ